MAFIAGWTTWIFLAQAGGGGGGGGGGGAFSFLPAMIVIFILLYFMMIRPERQKQKAHQAALLALKKNDRVVTVGGIYGIVTDVQRDVDKVTVRIDETTSAKIKVTVNSIARVIVDDAGKETAGKK